MKLNHTLIGRREDRGRGAVMLEGVIVSVAASVEAERVSGQRGVRGRGRAGEAERRAAWLAEWVRVWDGESWELRGVRLERSEKWDHWEWEKWVQLSRGVIGSVRSVFLVLANRNRNFRFVKFPTETDWNNWKPISFGCILISVSFSRFSISVNIIDSQSQKEKNNSTSHGVIDFSIRK